MKKYNGFTLIELMVVVAIIGIISAIAYPSYDSYMKKSRRADAKVGLSKIADRLERFYLDSYTYTTSFTDIKTSTISDEGYYSFVITSTDPLANYEITATAIDGQMQKNDTTTPAGNCTVLVLSSTDLRTAPLSNDPLGNNPDVPDCW